MQKKIEKSFNLSENHQYKVKANLATMKGKRWLHVEIVRLLKSKKMSETKKIFKRF